MTIRNMPYTSKGAANHDRIFNRAKSTTTMIMVRCAGCQTEYIARTMSLVPKRCIECNTRLK